MGTNYRHVKIWYHYIKGGLRDSQLGITAQGIWSKDPSKWLLISEGSKVRMLSNGSRPKGTTIDGFFSQV